MNSRGTCTLNRTTEDQEESFVLLFLSCIIKATKTTSPIKKIAKKNENQAKVICISYEGTLVIRLSLLFFYSGKKVMFIENTASV